MRRRCTTLLFALLILAVGVPQAPAAFETEVVDQGVVFHDPQVEFDAHGNALAVWSSEVYPENLIRVARRPAGGSFGEPQTVSNGGYNQQPALAVDPQGNAVVAWRHAGPGCIVTTCSVQVAYLPADGGPAVLEEFPEGAPFSPRAAMDSSGNALVSWSSTFEGRSRIFASFRPSGGTFGAPTLVSGPSDQANASQLAFDRTGNAFAVWRDGPSLPASGGQVHFAVRPRGGSFGPPQAISQSGYAVLPVIGVDADGGAVVVWTRRVEGVGDVRAAFGTAAGFGPEQMISAGDRHALAVAASGEAVTTYATDNLGSVTSAFRAPGQLFQPGQQLSSQEATGANDSEIAISPRGRAVAAWREHGSSTTLRAAMRPSGGLFGDFAVLETESPGRTFEAWATAASPRGDALVVWQTLSHPPGNSAVWAAFSPAPNVPPDCSSVTADPSTLRPANRRFRRILLTAAPDPNGDEITITGLGVTQDEPIRDRGDRTAPDARLSAGGTRILLRAERGQRDDGRVYRIAFEADDGHGGSCTGSVDVGVPRHERVPAVDSRPPEYDSLGD